MVSGGSKEVVQLKLKDEDSSDDDDDDDDNVDANRPGKYTHIALPSEGQT